jgi:hypothetical protein
MPSPARRLRKVVAWLDDQEVVEGRTLDRLQNRLEEIVTQLESEEPAEPEQPNPEVLPLGQMLKPLLIGGAALGLLALLSRSGGQPQLTPEQIAMLQAAGQGGQVPGAGPAYIPPQNPTAPTAPPKN